MISVYQGKKDNNVTSRDYEAMKRYIDLIQWGRKNPVQFIEHILGIQLMDYQRWLIAMTWTATDAAWACSRNIGKSFLLGCYIMARNILFPKFMTRIISENWTTANDTFKKMEDIATNNIKTIINTNTVFIDELLKSKSDSDGFTHDAKNGSKCALLNGSEITAVAGASKSARGKRSNLNIYDEAGFVSKETFEVCNPYTVQDSGFKLGANFDADIYPMDMPNQRLYVGSASDTDSFFYKQYREGTKRMLMGDRNWFVADLSCDVPMHPTVNGIAVPPLLSQATVDAAMRENEIIANREYYNIFDHFNLEDAVVTRTDILQNTENFIPVTSWGGRKHKYLIAYDPASKVDNSPILVMEVYLNEMRQWSGRCVYMENLIVRYGDGSKRPMRIDEQVNRIRQLLYEFNGRDKVVPYENVTLLIDAGIGGQSSSICQELAKPWKDALGKEHPGLVDEDNEYSVLWAEPYRKKCVSGCLKMVEPAKFRNAMFEAANLLVPQGNVKFTPRCPKYDILVLDDGSEKRLNKVELNALIQMDLMKEEIISIVKIKNPTTNRITYQLPTEKKNKMHDDRNYVFVMCCWELKNIRDNEEYGDGTALDYSNMFNKDKKKVEAESDPWLKAVSHVKIGNKTRSPFSGKSPFTK